MNHRIRRCSTTTSATYLRYLKPGALAQLRDSKIKSKTQIYLNHTLLTSSLSASPSSVEESNGTVNGVSDGVNSGANGERSPCFAVRLYGPRCIQRKKLVAARSMFFLNPNTIAPISDGPEPVIDAFSNDMLIAH